MSSHWMGDMRKAWNFLQLSFASCSVKQESLAQWIIQLVRGKVLVVTFDNGDPAAEHMLLIYITVCDG